MKINNPSPHVANETFLDVGQVAARWHVTKETVRRKIRRGEIQVSRPCGRMLISLSEIERVEKERT